VSLLWAKRGWLTPGSQTLRALNRFGASDVWDFVDNSYMRAGVVTTNAGLTVTRASSGYAETSDGRLVSFASGELRRTDRGVLVEGARTNLLLRSQEFNASWVTANLTITGGQLAPDNTLTAQRLEATATAATTCVQAVTVAATTATGAVYVKQGSGVNEANTITLRNATTATILIRGTLNFSTGVWTYVTGSTGVVVTPAANGFWRVALTATSGITSGDSIQLYVGYQGGSETAGRSLIAWGAQLEAASFASSYIPTEGSTVTRATDNVSASYALVSPTSVYVEYQPLEAVTTAGVAAQWGTSPIRARIGRSVSGGNLTGAEVYVQNTSDQAVLRHGAGTANANAIVRQAVRIGTDDFASCAAGGTVLTDTSGTVPASLTLIYIGSELGSNSLLGGYIRRLALFPRLLTNAELQGITT
jgi:hypothetical protein